MNYIPLLGLRSPSSNTPTDVVQSQTTPEHTHASHHHNHNHAHLHTARHPTQKAYVAHMNAKEAAQIRIADSLQKRHVPAFRPLVITNHLQDETVYPGYSSKQQSGGFKLLPGQQVTVQLPLGEIDMLRVWIRRGCIEGSKEGELHCLTGDCNGKLECDVWPSYGSSQLENAFYPHGDPPGAWLDGSNVEGSTMLPLSVSMDGCMTLHCDTSHITCPEEMQVKDNNGKLLACSCGHSDWNRLQAECPDHGGADIQSQWKEACPDFYSYSSDDLTGQKYCPYEAANAMRVDIGIPTTSVEPSSPHKESEQVPLSVAPKVPVTQEVKQIPVVVAPEITPAPSTKAIWGPGVDGFDEWVKTYEWNGQV
jgi:hypothetical protein